VTWSPERRFQIGPQIIRDGALQFRHHRRVKIYHYAVSATARETAPESQLPDLVLGGILRPDTLVWTDGMAQWTPAGQAVPELFAERKLAVRRPAKRWRFDHRSHAIDFEIHGDDLQMSRSNWIRRDRDRRSGAMCFMEEGIEFETKMGDGSAPVSGFMGAIKAIGKRVLTGESIFMTHFTHRGRSAKSKVCFAAPYPGKIVPLNLAELGGEILCEKDAFLCAALGTSVGIAFNKKLGVGFFGVKASSSSGCKGTGSPSFTRAAQSSAANCEARCSGWTRVASSR
jgi:hypothetical protein